MARPTLQLFEESFPRRGAFDTAISRALLEAVARGRCGENLRLYTPGDVLAFSLMDRKRPGFARAVAIARQHGFEPVLRLTGGRAAVFHRETLAFAWCRPTDDPRHGIRERFDDAGTLLSAALRGLGLDARVGEVPGEYCPGEHSINLGGRVKVSGVGQRVVKGAAHVGGVIVVRDADRARRVLEPVYAELGYPMDPVTVGSLDQAAPELRRSEVVRAVAAAFARRFAVEPGRFDRDLLERAEAGRARHEVDATESADERPAEAAGKALASH
jgi:lipoate-protein ligase A